MHYHRYSSVGGAMARVVVVLLAVIMLSNSFVMVAHGESENTLTLIYGSYNLGNIQFYRAPFQLSGDSVSNYSNEYGGIAGNKFTTSGISTIWTEQEFVCNYDFSGDDKVKFVYSFDRRRLNIPAWTQHAADILDQTIITIYYDDGSAEIYSQNNLPDFGHSYHKNVGEAIVVDGGSVLFNFTVPQDRIVKRIVARQTFVIIPDNNYFEYVFYNVFYGMHASLTYSNPDTESLTLLGSIIAFLQSIWQGIVNLPGNIASSLGSFFVELGQKIVALPGQIWQLISDGLQWLFIPPDDFFDQIGDDIDAAMEDHLGFFYDIIKLARDMKTIITSPAISGGDELTPDVEQMLDSGDAIIGSDHFSDITQNGYTFVLPGFTYTDQNVSVQLWPRTSVNLKELIETLGIGWIFTLINLYISVHLVLSFCAKILSYLARQFSLEDDAEYIIDFILAIDKFFWIANPLR